MLTVKSVLYAQLRSQWLVRLWLSQMQIIGGLRKDAAVDKVCPGHGI